MGGFDAAPADPALCLKLQAFLGETLRNRHSRLKHPRTEGSPKFPWHLWGPLPAKLCGAIGPTPGLVRPKNQTRYPKSQLSLSKAPKPSWRIGGG